VQPATQNAQTHWKPVYERVLIDILKDQIKDGVEDSFGQHLYEITLTLNSRIDNGTIFQKDQVKKKISYLKTMYKEYIDLISGAVTTGSGWDAKRNTIALTAEQWIQLRDVRILSLFLDTHAMLQFHMLTKCTINFVVGRQHIIMTWYTYSRGQLLPGNYGTPVHSPHWIVLRSSVSSTSISHRVSLI
jgi:hypothetical protein